MKKLAIVGAGGHSKVIADIARKNGYEGIVFLDDYNKISFLGEYPIIGDTDTLIPEDYDVFIAIGNAETRKRMTEKFTNRNIVTLIHPNAVIADDAKIGKGTCVMAGAVINPGVVIGNGCIVNTSSSVDHDSVLGDYVHVSVGAHIAGTVIVGDGTWVGIGAVISNNINVCRNCMLGAGTVVVKDILTSGTYVGVPARLIKLGD